MTKLIHQLWSQSAIRYFFISCFVTVVDTAVVYVLHFWMDQKIVIANTVGVVTGFILHYWLAKRFVFIKARGLLWVLQYTLVFLMGLFLADLIIWFVYEEMGTILLIAKFTSIVVPYFFMYFMRRYLYKKGQR